MGALDKFKKVENKKLKKRLKLGTIIIVPFITILLVIILRHSVMPTNEEILEKVRGMSEYGTIVEYTISNARGEYVEKAKLHYSANHDPTMEFGDKLVKTYKEDSISMKYKDGKEYSLEKDTDSFYILAIMDELLKNPITKIEEGSAEWGDLNYLKINIDIVSKNNHLDKAILYINKQEKIPMLIKIFDINGKERVKIEYREFDKKDKC